MAELFSTALLLTVFGLLMLVGVLSSRALERLGVPIALLFLLVGMLGGSEGLGGIEFDDYRLAFRIGTVALALILFEGGLSTSPGTVRAALLPGIVLATFGVAGTAALVAGFDRLLGSPWPHALLLGAIVSSTDAAVIFAVLRGGNLRLAPRVARLLEFESGLNDPLAVILTTGLTAGLAVGAATADGSLTAAQPTALLAQVPLQLAIGAAVGTLCGMMARLLLRRVRLTTGGLYVVLTLGLVCVSFGLASLLGGSGFLAVYAAGLVLGYSPVPYRLGLHRIHAALAWLAQITLFLMLGLLVFPSRLVEVALPGTAVALFLALVARPLVVWACLRPFRYTGREIAFVGWVGLRGAVPIVLATFPVLAGVPGAETLFDVVFFVVVVNAIVPGATIRWATRRLGLELPAAPHPAAALEINSTRALHGDILTFYVSPALAVCNALLSEIEFPPDSAAILVVRGEELLAARGNTRLQTGDFVFVFCQAADRPFLELLFGAPEE